MACLAAVERSPALYSGFQGCNCGLAPDLIKGAAQYQAQPRVEIAIIQLVARVLGFSRSARLPMKGVLLSSHKKRKLLNLEEAADFVGITPRQLHRAAKAGSCRPFEAWRPNGAPDV